MNGQIKILQANRSNNKVEVAILRQNRHFFRKRIKQDKEAHYIMIKGLIHKKDIILIDTCIPHIGTSKYLKQIQT